MRPIGFRRVNRHGYATVFRPDHPLVAVHKINSLLEHRVVFFDAYGLGPHKCHVCGNSLAWMEMDIDHLDNDKINNALSNLAAACPICNRMRGTPQRVESLRRRAKQITYDGRTMCASEWAEALGMGLTTFVGRINMGWPMEEIVATPLSHVGRPALYNLHRERHK